MGCHVAWQRYLHWDGKRRAEAFGADLALVDDDDELMGPGLHHLLPKQRSAAALYQVQSRVHWQREADITSLGLQPGQRAKKLVVDLSAPVSAPSMVTSRSSSRSSRVAKGMPASSAMHFVLSEVGTQT
eukprot:scaffold91_cov254-Pinguiococcus_pyrenoidosus.AAC.30